MCTVKLCRVTVLRNKLTYCAHKANKLNKTETSYYLLVII